MPLPDVEKISRLIDALKAYAVNNAQAYHPPCLASWDALMWFDLVPDWELIDFLMSGTDKARLLVKSLQSCLQWFEQNEIEEIQARLKIMSIIN